MSMNDRKKLFSKLPKVDEVLSYDEIIQLINRIPRQIVVETIREEIDYIRQSILDENITIDKINKQISSIVSIVQEKTIQKAEMKFKKVVNATGTVIHTNLGRSLIGDKIIEHVMEMTTNYSNLEYDLEKGARGSRYSHVENIITRVTGAESALIVNNNAAAVMLTLSTLAKNKEVVVSRGELVEIGGSFRVPDVMEQSGAKLVAVGTTNKTHTRDYLSAISEETAALLKVHTSNYRVLGFTSSVSLDELVSIGKGHNIPVFEDIGSGVLIDLRKYGLTYEPTVQESIKAGIDIVTFSGDKLLGGPQAGIIIGKREYIEEMKKNPLTRAIRVDKFTLSCLEATLRLYLNEKTAIKEIPTLRMITTSFEELERKANKLYSLIKSTVGNRVEVNIVNETSQVGGGSMPLEKIPTKAIVLYYENGSIASLERKLRQLETPIITRIYKDKMYLDLRTIKENDFNIVADGINKCLNS